MKHGACASGDTHSAKAGADVLQAGGNAVDAAVAAGLTACVTIPTMTSLGGGGLMTVLIDGRVTVCDHFAAVPGLDLKKRGDRAVDIVTVDFEGISVDFRVREPSIAVPGTVAGLWELHLRHGRMPLAEVARPAIDAARGGFTVTAGQRKAYLLLAEIYRMTPESFRLIAPADAVAEVGDRLDNRDLADTLACLVEDGPAAFYDGEVARAIVEAADGWVTRADLAAYRPLFREPVERRYRGWSLHLPAMPSVTGGMLLGALDHLGSGEPLPPRLDVPACGRLVEAMRCAEAVRTEEYERRLFDAGYVQSLYASSASGSTLHLSTADDEGNLVAYTTTVGESAGLVAPGTGVILNNFLGEEDILPFEGLHAAGQRMMTAMCPVLLHDGETRRIALGSAGSSRIKSAVLQLIVHLVDGGARPREAVLRPRLHTEAGTLYIEGHGRTKAEVDALRVLCDDVKATWDCGFFFGGAQVVERDGDTFATGADEERRGGVGYVV